MSDSLQLERYYNSLSDDALIGAYRKGVESYRTDAWRTLTSEIAARGLQERLSEDPDAAARSLGVFGRFAPGLLPLASLARRLRIAWLYTVFAIPAFLMASGLSVLAIEAADSLDFAFDRLPVLNLVVSLAPAVAGGFVTYLVVAERALRVASASVPRHLWRAWPLYAGAIYFGTVFVRGWSSPGFGLIAQLFLWPALAFTGGILADALAGARRSRRKAPIRDDRPV